MQSSPLNHPDLHHLTTAAFPGDSIIPGPRRISKSTGRPSGLEYSRPPVVRGACHAGAPRFFARSIGPAVDTEVAAGFIRKSFQSAPAPFLRARWGRRRNDPPQSTRKTGTDAVSQRFGPPVLGCFSFRVSAPRGRRSMEAVHGTDAKTYLHPCDRPGAGAVIPAPPAGPAAGPMEVVWRYANSSLSSRPNVPIAGRRRPMVRPAFAAVAWAPATRCGKPPWARPSRPSASSISSPASTKNPPPQRLSGRLSGHKSFSSPSSETGADPRGLPGFFDNSRPGRKSRFLSLRTGRAFIKTFVDGVWADGGRGFPVGASGSALGRIAPNRGPCAVAPAPAAAQQRWKRCPCRPNITDQTRPDMETRETFNARWSNG